MNCYCSSQLKWNSSTIVQFVNVFYVHVLMYYRPQPLEVPQAKFVLHNGHSKIQYTI
jgi:hypothetical protein